MSGALVSLGDIWYDGVVRLLGRTRLSVDGPGNNIIISNTGHGIDFDHLCACNLVRNVIRTDMQH